MIFTESKLRSAFIIELEPRADDRGFFARAFCQREFESHGLKPVIAQANIAFNRYKGTVRGMHFQFPPAAESKLVRCTRGAILDVIVDLRKDSPTYGRYHAEELSEDNHHAYFIPEGFAHGFKALTEGAMTYYLVSSEYEKESDTGVRWDSLGFDWQCKAPIMSARDQSFGALSAFQSPF